MINRAKLTQNETLKRLANKKIILGLTALIFAIAFIAITSFVPFVITKEKLSSEKFWTDELIIIAITIFSLVSVMFVGQASNAQNKDSELAKSKVEFKFSVEKITNLNFFSQWVKKVLQPRDIQYIKERELRKMGIDDYTILQLDDMQIRALGTGAQKYELRNGEKRYYSQISEEQVEKILELKDGVRKIHLVEPGYYLSVSSIEADKTDSEKSGRENFKKSMKLLFSVSSKIIISVIPALIFAALARDLNNNADAAEAWATFIARMISLISSAFMGYLVGCQMNDIDADYILLRVRVHKKYLQDTEFKPKGQQEMARQEFIDRVKKDNEEFGKSLGLKEREETAIPLPMVESTEKKEPVEELPQVDPDEPILLSGPTAE